MYVSTFIHTYIHRRVFFRPRPGMGTGTGTGMRPEPTPLARHSIEHRLTKYFEASQAQAAGVRALCEVRVIVQNVD